MENAVMSRFAAQESIWQALPCLVMVATPVGFEAAFRRSWWSGLQLSVAPELSRGVERFDLSHKSLVSPRFGQGFARGPAIVEFLGDRMVRVSSLPAQVDG